MPKFIPAASFAIVAFMLLGASPLYAQDQSPDSLTPEEMQRQLAQNLPPGWQISSPELDLGVWQSKISVPARWTGNPEAAAINFCPSADSDIWRVLPQLQLSVRYKGRNWPPYNCRP